MGMQHNCGQCSHLTRTSPEQVFLLCRYWAHPKNGLRDDYGYVVTHCHMQPEATACGAFRPRDEVSDGAASNPRELLCAS